MTRRFGETSFRAAMIELISVVTIKNRPKSCQKYELILKKCAKIMSKTDIDR